MTESTTDSVQTSEVSGEQTPMVTDETVTNGNATGDSQEQTKEEGAEQADSESSETVSPELSKINPDDLSDELKAVYKNMQAAFTKDRQGFKELEKKANLYEQLQQEQLVKSKFPEQPQKTAPETTDYLTEALGVDAKSLDDNQRAQVEQLAKIVDAAVNKRVAENIQPIQHDLLMRDYQQELAGVREKYADFNDYHSDVKDLVAQNPQMSYEQAYMVASFENQGKKGRTEALKNLENKEQRSTPKTTKTAKEGENPKGFDNIFKWAVKQHNNS